MSVENIVNINESNLQQVLEPVDDHSGAVLFLV